MARSWTNAQLEAINSSNRDLLVCAAAGSGKTAVLTERIIRYVTNKENPGHISRLLIVTFTKAAAAELRSRIRSALEEKMASEPSEHLAKEVLAVSGARISTIHSFCQDLIRSEGGAIGISTNMRLLEQSEADVLALKVMNEVIYEKSGTDSGFAKLTESLVGYKNDRELAKKLIDIYEKLTDIPEGCELLKTCAEEAGNADTDILDTFSGKALKNTVLHSLETFKARYLHIFGLLPPEHHYTPTVEEEINKLSELVKALEKGYACARASFNELASFSQLNRGKKSKDNDTAAEEDAFKAVRAELKDFTASLSAFFAQTDEETKTSRAREAKLFYTLYETEKLFSERLSAYKKNAEVCTFSDLEHYAIELLYNSDGTLSPIAHSVSSCFDRVFIDEYQDVNALQRMIFDALACHAASFRVGDIKQSIYAFRGADPSIIDSLRKEYESDDSEDNKNIFMSRNFRSSKKILDFINEVFEPYFRNGAFAYSDDDRLCYRSDEQPEHEPNVTVILCKSGNKKDGTVGINEEIIVADEIERLVAEGRLANGERIRYKDIALLFRSYKSHAGKFIKELESRGIPVTGAGKRPLFDGIHTRLVLSLLQCADNPLRDVPLCAVLLSPVIGLTADEIVTAKQEEQGTLWENLTAAAEKHNGKFAEAVERISVWRDKGRRLPCNAFLRYLFSNEGISVLLCAEAEGEEAKQAVTDDLNVIYELARGFEKNGNKGLCAFVAFLEEYSEQGASVESGVSTEMNAVRLMTVHASKGLEFPVCFVCCTHARKNGRDKSERVQFSPHAGVGMLLTDPRGFVLINTPTREAVRFVREANSLYEDERTLYVALTRAREMLYVTADGVPEGLIKDTESETVFRGIRSPRGMSSSIEAVLRAAYAKSEIATVRTVMPVEENAPVYSENTSVHADNETAVHRMDDKKCEELAAILKSRLEFEYKDAYLSAIPAKMSVSQLSPSVLNEAAPLLSEENGEYSILREPETEAFTDMPEFVAGETAPDAAEKGTATHQFLQFCNITRARETGAKEEALTLLEQGFISERQYSCLRTDELDVFINSDFCARLLKSESIRREFRFNCFMPADKLTDIEDLKTKLEGKELAVQGVIDGFFIENGNVYLFDYKTDRIPKHFSDLQAENMLKERYNWQLSCYAAALRRIFGKPVSGALIYSTVLGYAFEVKADMI